MGVRGRFRLGLFAVLLASCAPPSVDRTPTGELTGGASGRPGGRGIPPAVSTESAGAGGGQGGSGGSGGTNGGAPIDPAPSDTADAAEGSIDAGPSPDAVDPPDAPPDARPLPPLLDARAASCNNLPTWQSGVQYQPGADVTHLDPRRRFECRPLPYSPWCALPAYEPGKNRHWPEAWIDRGQCP